MFVIGGEQQQNRGNEGGEEKRIGLRFFSLCFFFFYFKTLRFCFQILKSEMNLWREKAFVSSMEPLLVTVTTKGYFW